MEDEKFPPGMTSVDHGVHTEFAGEDDSVRAPSLDPLCWSLIPHVAIHYVSLIC